MSIDLCLSNSNINTCANVEELYWEGCSTDVQTPFPHIVGSEQLPWPLLIEVKFSLENEVEDLYGLLKSGNFNLT